MPDGRTGMRFPSRRCPHDGTSRRSTLLHLLHRKDMECAHIFSSLDSPLIILSSRRAHRLLTDCTRFSKGWVAEKRKVLRNLGSATGIHELSKVSTNGGRVGISTRYLLTK